MQAAILLTVASLAAVLGVQPEEVKPNAGAAHYGGGYGGRPQYTPSYNQPGFWQPLLQDRFVCDLDASVLLVVDHNRHHRNHFFGTTANRAVRVKCSEVANNDEDSCNLCCQQTARRDTTLANDKLFGFLAITKDDDDKTFTRSKRDTEDEEEENEEDDVEELRDDRRRRGGFHRVDPTYVVQAKWTPDEYNTNVKCVCCAPRTSPAAQNPSTYGNVAQSPPASNYNNVAQSPPATNYNSAAQSPSTYTTTTVTQPQPVAAASQPLVDSWQTDNVSDSWGAAADAAPAVTPAPANAY